jgi:hypothetical protein
MFIEIKGGMATTFTVLDKMEENNSIGGNTPLLVPEEQQNTPLYNLFENPNKLRRRDLYFHPEVRHYCSSLHGNKPIFKFSELFAPPPPSQGFSPRKKHKITLPPDIIEQMCERSQLDEIKESFDEEYEVDSVEEPEEVEKVEPEPMAVDNVQEPVELEEKPTCTFALPRAEDFHPLQLQEWETKIIWEPPQEKVSDSTFRIIKRYLLTSFKGFQRV